MPEQLMYDVWLRSVQRHTVMSDVLGGVEDFESQAIQKLSLRQKPANWLQPPASFALQKFRYGIELWDILSGEAHMLLELVDGPSELLACVSFEQLLEAGIAELPDVFLCLSV